MANNKDIWYSSTLGYEGAGTGVSTSELFNAIQKLLKLYADNSSSSPSMIVGNKRLSHDLDTDLTHIEKTFAVKIEKSLKTVVENAINSFMKTSPLTKDTNTYKVFSQGIVPSITRKTPLTQPNAITEAQRELEGTMAQIYSSGGSTYITALGANQAELNRLSKSNFSSIMPNALSMQNEYIKSKAAEDKAKAEIQADKERKRQETESKKREADEAKAERARKKAEAEEKLKQDKIKSENAALVKSSEDNRSNSLSAKSAYKQAMHDSRYKKYLKEQKHQAWVDSIDESLEESRPGQDEARKAYYKSQHDARYNKRYANQKPELVKGFISGLEDIKDKKEAYNEDLLNSAEEDRRIQDEIREQYYKRRHDERYDAWIVNQAREKRTIAKASESMSKISKGKIRSSDLRSIHGKGSDSYVEEPIVDDDEDEDVSSEEESSQNSEGKSAKREQDAKDRHHDKLRTFGLITAGIAILVNLVSKILNFIGNTFKEAGQAGVEVITNRRTARNLGMNPYELYRLSNLAVEKGLDKNIFTDAFSGLSDTFGQALNTDTYDIFKNAGFDIVMGNDDIEALIKNSFSGGSSEEYARRILNAYLQRYKDRKPIVGDNTSEAAVYKQLYDSLNSISQPLASLFSTMVDTGNLSYEEFINSSNKGLTGYSERDMERLGTLGDAINTFNAFWDETKLNIFTELSSTIKELIAKVRAIIGIINKDVTYEERIEAVIANKEGSDKASIAFDRISSEAFKHVQGSVVKGKYIETERDLESIFSNENGVLDREAIIEYYKNNKDPNIRYLGYIMDAIEKYKIKADKRVADKSMINLPFIEEDVISKAYAEFTDSFTNSSDQLITTDIFNYKFPTTEDDFYMEHQNAEGSSYRLPDFMYDSNGNLLSDEEIKKLGIKKLNYRGIRGGGSLYEKGSDKRNQAREYIRKLLRDNVYGKDFTDPTAQNTLKEVAELVAVLGMSGQELFYGIIQDDPEVSKSQAANFYNTLMSGINRYNVLDSAMTTATNGNEYFGFKAMPGMENFTPKESYNLFKELMYVFPGGIGRKDELLEQGEKLMKGSDVSLIININDKQVYGLDTNLQVSDANSMFTDYQKSNNWDIYTEGSIGRG